MAAPYVVSQFPAGDLGRYYETRLLVPSIMENRRNYLERRRVLRALSQVCRGMRELLLPIVWETFEACASLRILDGPDFAETEEWDNVVARTLLKKSETVLDYPYLASYIQ